MPPEGIPLARRFPPDDLKRMYENLRRTGEPFGIIFGDVKVTANSRLSLLASEFARDCGHYDSFHSRVFHAYFTETRDIGKLDVILDLAEKEGLDREELRRTLGDGTYLPRLAEARKEGDALGVTAVPTFIVDQRQKIVGALPLDLLRKRFSEVLG